MLDGKVAVVTGASRGIGRAIAEALVKGGARVAVCGRDQAKLAAAAVEIAESHRGASVLWVPCDVAKFEDVRRLHARVDAELGVPDLLVNNAGVVVRERLDEMSEASWDAVIGANLKGTFNVTRVFLPQMRARRSGRIVNVASISGRRGTARLTAYCAAKHGVVGLTRALAEETRDHDIQVNAIAPGSVDTEMLEGSGFEPRMSPEDVARVCVWLLGEAPAALTGACVDVFG